MVSPEPIEPPGFFSGLRARALLIGALADQLATLLGYTALFVAIAAQRGIDLEEEIPAEVFEQVVVTPEFLLWGFVVGFLCSVFGGFVGAWRAGLQHTRHGAFVGLASLGVGLVGLALAEPAADPPPLWYDLLGAASVIPAAALGGWLSSRLAPGRPT